MAKNVCYCVVLRCVDFFSVLFSFSSGLPQQSGSRLCGSEKKEKKLPPQADSGRNNGANPTPATQPSAGWSVGWTRSPPHIPTRPNPLPSPQQSSPGPTGSAPPHKGTFFRINRERLLPVGLLLPLRGLHQSDYGQNPVTGSIPPPQTRLTVVSSSSGNHISTFQRKKTQTSGFLLHSVVICSAQVQFISPLISSSLQIPSVLMFILQAAATL